MSYHIQLPRFEGPLDLLLYLIRKEEMDIMDIEIHKITAQYLEFIQLMKELDLEVAGEFVAMAATLLQIKSKLLLPNYDENGEVIETEDPRKELVQRLLEYEKYKEAAKSLQERPWLGRDIWTRGVRQKLGEVEEEIVIDDNGLFSLIAMYRAVLRTAKKKVHQVAAKTQSIASRIMELKSFLRVGEKVSFFSIIEGAEDLLRQKLITFLSLLELGKLGFATLYQTDAYQDIWVETTKPIENDVVSRVEEYDKIQGDDSAADQIFAKAAAALSTTEQVAQTDEQNEEFILKDSFAEEAEEESLFTTEDVASDEDILAAERELAHPSTEPVVHELAEHSFEELAKPTAIEEITGIIEIPESLEEKPVENNLATNHDDHSGEANV
jgi:segregation and condensation protein A